MSDWDTSSRYDTDQVGTYRSLQVGRWMAIGFVVLALAGAIGFTNGGGHASVERMAESIRARHQWVATPDRPIRNEPVVPEAPPPNSAGWSNQTPDGMGEAIEAARLAAEVNRGDNRPPAVSGSDGTSTYVVDGQPVSIGPPPEGPN